MSRWQGGTDFLKRAGLCEHETERYGELDGQSVARPGSYT